MTAANGLLLMLVGIGSYLVSGGASLTALIPAAFGLPLVACGLWQRRAPEAPWPHRVALAWSCLGLLAVTPRLLSTLPRWASDLSLALVAQAVLFLVLLLQVVVSVRAIRAG